MTVLSFIITTYNIPELMLRKCIESILALSLSKDEREIILIDDGSKETPLFYLSDIEDNIIYVRQKNSGLSVARNLGISIATGNYIQFVDGDDYLITAPYEHCLDMVRYHNPDAVLFMSTDKKAVETPFTFNGPMTGAAYIHNNSLRGSGCGYIFRRSMLLDLRFTTGIMHEDEEFTPLLLLRAERLFATDAKAYYYRKRKDSIMHNSNSRHRLQRLDDAELVIYRLQDKLDMLPEAERSAMKRRVAQLTMDLLYNTIKLTHSTHRLNKLTERLEQKNLFPLPDKKYTWKYIWFRKMTKNKIGRTILTRLCI